ncbi:MAG: DUF1592 domain-containing protein [Planctomycetota bacterium]|nr:DUF1592 domain-containing protein [Planctomycetota bacterium]
MPRLFSYPSRQATLSCLVFLYAATAPLRASETPEVPDTIRSLLRRFCFDCHSGDSFEGGISLQTLSEQNSFTRDFRAWRMVTEQVRKRQMPPRDAAQPSAAQRKRLSEWIQQRLQQAVTQHTGDPGRIVMRRLTSAEYDYTIRDLTGLRLDVHRGFVGDAVGGAGFTNSGGVQFIQDTTLQRYLDAARQVAEHAVIGAGPLAFHRDPGNTGFELSAITRIQSIYRNHGFRTAAGEGGEPFGLDRYPKAFYAAWLFTHRRALGRSAESYPAVATAAGLDPPFLKYIHLLLQQRDLGFPTSEIAHAWQQLPAPPDATDDAAQQAFCARIQERCQQLAQRVRHWQNRFGSNADAKEEAPVLRADLFHVKRSQRFEMNINWPPNTAVANLILSVESALPEERPHALVIWKSPRIQFRVADLPEQPFHSLREVVTTDVARQLRFGEHPRQGNVAKEDFTTLGTEPVRFAIPIPENAGSARLLVDAQLDVKRGADCIIRCSITQLEETDQGKSVSALLANPGSPAFQIWKEGVLQFARLLPQVSQREPAPSDRDPIPKPFDRTYNNPQRNAFHTRIKYARDDQFLVEHMLDAATRQKLNRAWIDLRTSFGYHDAWLLMLSEMFEIPLGDLRMKDLDPQWLEALSAEPRGYLTPLQLEYQTDRQALESAHAGHLQDVLQFATRAWRRPLSQQEAARIRSFYSALRTENHFEHIAAVRAVLTRVLVSPAFLYRAERIAADGSDAPLSDWELASRLSYLCWSSVPDDALRAAAAGNQLQDPQVLARHARRMLADPKATRFATEFFGQWFGFYRFDQYRGVDTSRFPEWSEAVQSAMYQEAVALCSHILRENLPPAELLFADYTFLNGPLASHYGVPFPKPAKVTASQTRISQLQRVDNMSTFHRGGLLRLGAVLTVTSAPLRTSPVRRGDWVLRQVLGESVPPPPADAGSIPADDVPPDGLSVRQRLAAHRRDVACVNCHARIDPFGFALEHYDSLGRWRDHYRDGKPIETSSELRDGTSIADADGLHAYLRSRQSQFHRTLATKLLGYALGRPETIGDTKLLTQMTTQLTDGAGLAELTQSIVKSRQFRYHANSASAPAPIPNSAPASR